MQNLFPRNNYQQSEKFKHYKKNSTSICYRSSPPHCPKSHTKANSLSLSSIEVLPIATEISLFESRISCANLFCVTKLITESFNQLNLIWSSLKVLIKGMVFTDFWPHNHKRTFAGKDLLCQLIPSIQTSTLSAMQANLAMYYEIHTQCWFWLYYYGISR